MFVIGFACVCLNVGLGVQCLKSPVPLSVVLVPFPSSASAFLLTLPEKSIHFGVLLAFFFEMLTTLASCARTCE